MFPLLTLAGGYLGGLVSYGANPEDPGEPSRRVTVMAVWEAEGEEVCRAFSYRDLLPHLDTLRLRFALTPGDVERCREDFAAYNSRDRWPIELSEGERGYPGYAFEIERPDPLEVMVHRATGDPAVWAQTRYRVTEEGSISELRTNTASAGQGLGPVLGGFVGMLAWALLAVLTAVRAWRTRGAS